MSGPMDNALLVLNAGSSSLKFAVYQADAAGSLQAVYRGVVEEIGGNGRLRIFQAPDASGQSDQAVAVADHPQALQRLLDALETRHPGLQFSAAGHRVVHGGADYSHPVRVDENVLSDLDKLIPLSPLHQPHNLAAIRALAAMRPQLPQVACFDTAFHHTLPPLARRFALPREFDERGIRRYGFHGTSYVYTAKRAAVLLGKEPKDTNLIICHIGNGASISAVRNGVGVDTSMGMTPLEGLVMGSRCGDLDPAILPYVMNRTGMSAKEMDMILNKKSGLIGLCGISDRRDVRKEAEDGNERAKTAIAVECHRLRKYIGAYAAILGRVDALVFTAGVGEMAPHIREKSTKDLDILGIKLDLRKNAMAQCRNAELEINTADSPVKIFVIPTDEELVMTEDAYALMTGTYDVHMNFTYSFQSKDYKNKAREQGLIENLKKKPELAELIVRP